MKILYVFFDGECGLCRRCREWLAGQPNLVRLVFHPFQSEEALRICPWLPQLQPEQQLIVMSDEGGIYVGEKAWLICLYALRDYRGWSEKLSAPALRPLARRICLLVSHNRLRLSKMLFQLPGHVIAGVVESEEQREPVSICSFANQKPC